MHDVLRLVAENPLGRIEQCPCGMMHLTVGALTPRLTPAMIDQLTLLLRGADLSSAFGSRIDAPLA